MELERMALIQWSDFIKISKFARKIGVSPQAVSAWLKYGQPTLTYEKKKLLYETVLEYMRNNFA